MVNMTDSGCGTYLVLDGVYGAEGRFHLEVDQQPIDEEVMEIDAHLLDAYLIQLIINYSKLTLQVTRQRQLFNKIFTNII